MTAVIEILATAGRKRTQFERPTSFSRWFPKERYPEVRPRQDDARLHI